jgi:hypothetical protein
VHVVVLGEPSWVCLPHHNTIITVTLHAALSAFFAGVPACAVVATVAAVFAAFATAAVPVVQGESAGCWQG